ncbi:MAG: hypothetical protein HQL42_00160 [Alphaproteobacteria bacterium]|nr:hypothetical protein [Alphaproteobacteria bacterium]
MKKILIVGGAVVAVVVVVVVGAVTFLFSNLDSLVKKAIESAGSEVAGVKVSVGDVKISLSEGKASISGLTVANPPGFTAPTAFALGQISVAIDTGSVTGNPIIIKDVTVAKPQVTYEMAGTGSNIDVIQKNVAAKTGGGGQKAQDKPAAKGEEKKLVIDRMAITGGTVTLATAMPGVKGSANLADIVLTGIGKKSGGATGAEIAAQVLDAITKSALNAGQSMGIGNVGEVLKGAVPGDAGGALKGIMGK